MTDLEKTLQKRSNISFFREDKIPEKSLIDEILTKAHLLTPHKNNFWHYEIEIYGPEYEEEKKYATLATVCSELKEKYSKSNATSEDFKELEKIYDLWLEDHKNIKTKEDFLRMRKKLNKIHFNNQVRAPYLLVYTKRDELLTNSQKNSDYYKNGRLNTIFDVNANQQSNMWLIQAGMHSILTSTLAIEKGLDASFCKCFFYNTNIHSNILRKAAKNSSNIAFLLGLGYKDDSKHQYKSYVPKPTLDEIVKWR
tara:strand:- start:293 stop:1051 length:759 start_codon:yes stop_codon:yes gene_type:complete